MCIQNRIKMIKSNFDGFQELCNARKREVESEDHLRQVGKLH